MEISYDKDTVYWVANEPVTNNGVQHTLKFGEDDYSPSYKIRGNKGFSLLLDDGHIKICSSDPNAYDVFLLVVKNQYLAGKHHVTLKGVLNSYT